MTAPTPDRARLRELLDGDWHWPHVQELILALPALLDRLDALEAENERLQARIRQLIAEKGEWRS